eukprot:TRINITY_DN8654_c0_g3_i2.p2 TRINITY_DN8654_c0_g3~~TRINITY_DN8654_c0_g3_i2.p2  ORF type:complete len:141 (-),score=20.24 TRINITY_DN8654_c0_g3_i2:153-575(-)
MFPSGAKLQGKGKEKPRNFLFREAQQSFSEDKETTIKKTLQATRRSLITPRSAKVKDTLPFPLRRRVGQKLRKYYTANPRGGYWGVVQTKISPQGQLFKKSFEGFYREIASRSTNQQCKNPQESLPFQGSALVSENSLHR